MTGQRRVTLGAAPSVPRSPLVVAALGPTNTGKTHRAVERMLEHASGMIGLPLRLLAREVYDKVSAKVGENAVALVTGEEKRIPPTPHYWVCTVEAMPVERKVDFLAVDEVQLAAHPGRGHIFTDRVLHARGRRETWFMGAHTLAGVLGRHVPQAELRRFPRLSRLSGAGQLGLGALPPRSAVVSFSVEGVYRLAERLRARKGGTAVVLGALSPRTRNAQVALFQAREVDYLVATDAIGMGLNLALSHVSFAELRKFDGRRTRSLSPAELAQIAGRAGRHVEDGTFSTLSPTPALRPEIERALERHAFPPEERLIWRNSALDFSSLDALSSSLKMRPLEGSLSLVPFAEDFGVLQELMRKERVRALAQDDAGVRLLWDACQIPDYRGLLLDAHSRLVLLVFTQLRTRGRLDSDWLAREIERLDETSGDVDALTLRIAFVRTWTYITHHRAWVSDGAAWQQRTREIEDRLSDALHARLVERFVRVRSTSRTAPPARSTGPLAGHPFRDLARELARTQDSGEAWIERVIEAPHGAFSVDTMGRIWHDGVHVGTLTRGIDILHPEIVVVRDVKGTGGEIGSGAALRVGRRLAAWLADARRELLGPLGELMAGASPGLRGLLYRLERGLGTLLRSEADAQLSLLSEDERRALGASRVCVGRRFVYLEDALDEQALSVRWALAQSYYGPGKREVFSAAGPSTERVSAVPLEAYTSAGFPVVASRAIRVDLIEQVAAKFYRSRRRLSREARQQVQRLLACRAEELPSILRALGYRPRRQRRRSGSTREAEAARLAQKLPSGAPEP